MYVTFFWLEFCLSLTRVSESRVQVLHSLQLLALSLISRMFLWPGVGDFRLFYGLFEIDINTNLLGGAAQGHPLPKDYWQPPEPK